MYSEYEELCDFSNRKMILLDEQVQVKVALLNQINKVDFYIQQTPIFLHFNISPLFHL